MRTLVLSGTFLLAATVGAAAQTADPVGEWLVKEGTARIKVVSCPPQVAGQPAALWGVIWAEMKPGIDDKNPDPAKRGQPTLGMAVLQSLKATEPNRWDGALYNSKNGKTYTGGIMLLTPDRVRVRGCVLGFLCGGEDWTRVDPVDDKAAPDATICAGMDKPR